MRPKVCMEEQSMKSSLSQSPIKVAVVQHPPVFLNTAESILKASRLIEEAADQGARVVAFPETWLPGYPVWLDCSPNAALWDYPPAKALFSLLVQNAVTLPGECLDALCRTAGRTGLYVVMGVHERQGGTLYNTMIFIGKNGRDYRIHRKLIPTYTERLVWGRGDGSTLSALETDFGKLGGLVCWEHWMPLARAAMHSMQEVIHVAQWPSVKDLHQLASRHYAFEGQCFVMAAGTVLTRGDILYGFDSLKAPSAAARNLLEAIPGKEEDLIMNGGSAIIGPDTNYLAGPVYDQSLILYGDLHPDRITEGHLTMDTSGHYSRPDIFSLSVDDRPQRDVTLTSGG